MYGPTTTARLKQQGMEFAVWVFKHADDAQLQPHSGTILQKLLQLLNEGNLPPSGQEKLLLFAVTEGS